jgi:hypothetical protein
MKFLPFDSLLFRSPLSPEDSISQLEATVEPKKVIRSSFFTGKKKTGKPFEGAIDHNTFNISRVIGYRNSFLPVVRGEVGSDHRGTTIRVTMKMHILVMIFLAVWLVAASTAFVAAFVPRFSDPMAIESGTTFIYIVPLMMVFFAYLAVVLSFNYERKKAIDLLIRIFQAEIED